MPQPEDFYLTLFKVQRATLEYISVGLNRPAQNAIRRVSFRCPGLSMPEVETLADVFGLQQYLQQRG